MAITSKCMRSMNSRSLEWLSSDFVDSVIWAPSIGIWILSWDTSVTMSTVEMIANCRTDRLVLMRGRGIMSLVCSVGSGTSASSGTCNGSSSSASTMLSVVISLLAIEVILLFLGIFLVLVTICKMLVLIRLI